MVLIHIELVQYYDFFYEIATHNIDHEVALGIMENRRQREYNNLTDAEYDYTWLKWYQKMIVISCKMELQLYMMWESISGNYLMDMGT